MIWRTDKYKAISAATPRNGNAAQQGNSSLFGTFLLHFDFRRLLLGVRIFLYLSLVDEIYRIHQVHVVFIHQRCIFCKLHQVGRFKHHLQVMDRFLVLLLQQTLDNFRRRLFHGIESETLLYYIYG